MRILDTCYSITTNNAERHNRDSFTHLPLHKDSLKRINYTSKIHTALSAETSAILKFSMTQKTDLKVTDVKFHKTSAQHEAKAIRIAKRKEREPFGY